MTIDHKWMCNECLSENCVKCDECGEYIEIEKSIEYDNDTLCERCRDKRITVIDLVDLSLKLRLEGGLQ